MKRLIYMLLGVAMLGSYGCSRDEVEYIPGKPDSADNYGVYFPKQVSSTKLELDPASSTDVIYKVRRTRTEGEITVPFKMEESEENIFIVSPIHFADGERETEIRIQFPRAVPGIEYSLTVTIDDPAYISTYSGNDTALSMSVIRAGWKSLGKGKWRDDILSSIYIGVPHAYSEVDIEIFEREDQPGMYRAQIFNKNYVYKLFDGIPQESDEFKYTIIDATDPSKVWIPMQGTGLVLSSEQGEIIISSNVDKVFSMDAAESQYGVLEENGVITFPIHGVLARLTSVDGDDQWRSVNSSGMMRIIMPGGRPYEYGLKLEREDGDDGSISVKVTTESDVARVKYAIVEGRLDDGQVSLTAQNLESGVLEYDGEAAASDNLRLKLEPEATGLYTFICCSYSSDGRMRDFKSLQFGYVHPGDDVPVTFTFGIEQTNELAGQGYDKSNSIKFYAYGEDIYSVRYALRRKGKVDTKLKDAEIIEKYGISMSAANLEEINSGSFRTLFTGLNGASEYTLYLGVDNGYANKVYTAQFTTEGVFNPILEGWSSNDFIKVNASTYKYNITTTTYNLYGVDLLDASTRLKKLGEVTIFDDDESAGYNDILNIQGLMSSIEIDDGKGEDEFHRRHLRPATDVIIQGTYDDFHSTFGPRYGLFSVLSIYPEWQENGTQYNEPVRLVYYDDRTFGGAAGSQRISLDGMMAGVVNEELGCLAFAPSVYWKENQEASMSLRFMGFVGNKTTFALYTSMMLIDKEKDPTKPDTILPVFSDLYSQTLESEARGSDSPFSAAPRNYVEFEAMPYNESVIPYLRAHSRNVFVYPQIPAGPARVVKAKSVITEETASGATHGEEPARTMSLNTGNIITARLK
ncbi:MAG: hypothetical protein J1E04_02380 [Alistipes sp.]|nr:hypothetical protein [Alistipes sp.]